MPLNLDDNIIPEDFYDVPGAFDSLVQFYSIEHKKLERDVLEMPITVLTAAIGNVIHIYGNFTDDVLKLLKQTVNPLWEPGEYKAKVYDTLKVGAVNENNPAIDKMAESLMFIRSLFERDKLMLSKYFNEEIEKVQGISIEEKTDKFAEALKEITKNHLCEVMLDIKLSMNQDAKQLEEIFENEVFSNRLTKDTLEKFIALGVDVKSLVSKNSAVILANLAINEGIDTVKFLRDTLDIKFDVTADGRTAVYIASQIGEVEAIKTLKALGADVNIPEKNVGATPVYIAAQLGQIEAIKTLQALGANVNTPTNDGATPVYIAAQLGQIEAIKTLQVLGANVNTPMNDGSTPLYVAAMNGHIEAIKTLQALGANVNTTTNDGLTVLHAAAWGGHADIVRMLVNELGLDPKAVDKVGTTIQQAIAASGNIELLRSAISEYKLDINAISNDKNTLLHTAARNGKLEMATELVTNPKFKLKVNAQNFEGLTPLHRAVIFNQPDMVKLLINELGAAISIPNKDGKTAFDLADNQEIKEILQAAMKKTKQQSGLPPLPSKQQRRESVLKEATANQDATEEITPQRRRGSSVLRAFNSSLEAMQSTVGSLSTRVRGLSASDKQKAAELQEVQLQTDANMQALASLQSEVSQLGGLRSQTTANAESLLSLKNEVSQIGGLNPQNIGDAFKSIQESKRLLDEQTTNLQEMVAKHTAGKAASAQLTQALSTPEAEKYYSDVKRLLNGVYAASASVNSGWVPTSKKGMLGGFGLFIRAAGGFSPVGGGAFVAVGELIGAIDQSIQKDKLGKFAQLCTEPGEMASIASSVAFALLLAGREKDKLIDGKNVKASAGKDVAAILNAVFTKDSKIIRNSNLSVVASQFVKVVTGKEAAVKVSHTRVAPETRKSWVDSAGFSVNEELSLKVTSMRKFIDSDDDKSDDGFAHPSKIAQILSVNKSADRKEALIKTHGITEEDYESIETSEKVAAILKFKKAQQLEVKPNESRKRINEEVTRRFLGGGLGLETEDLPTKEDVQKFQSAKTSLTYILPMVFINVKISDEDKGYFNIDILTHIKTQVRGNPAFIDHLIDSKTSPRDMVAALKEALREQKIIVGGQVDSKAINDKNTLKSAVDVFAKKVLEPKEATKTSALGGGR